MVIGWIHHVKRTKYITVVMGIPMTKPTCPKLRFWMVVMDDEWVSLKDTPSTMEGFLEELCSLENLKDVWNHEQITGCIQQPNNNWLLRVQPSPTGPPT